MSDEIKADLREATGDYSAWNKHLGYAVLDEIERLEARVAELECERDSLKERAVELYRDNQRAAKIIDAARAEAEANRLDAERWRWYASHAIEWDEGDGVVNGYILIEMNLRGRSLDAAIDAVREGWK